MSSFNLSKFNYDSIAFNLFLCHLPCAEMQKRCRAYARSSLDQIQIRSGDSYLKYKTTFFLTFCPNQISSDLANAAFTSASIGRCISQSLNQCGHGFRSLICLSYFSSYAISWRPFSDCKTLSTACFKRLPIQDIKVVLYILYICIFINVYIDDQVADDSLLIPYILYFTLYLPIQYWSHFYLYFMYEFILMIIILCRFNHQPYSRGRGQCSVSWRELPPTLTPGTSTGSTQLSPPTTTTFSATLSSSMWWTSRSSYSSGLRTFGEDIAIPQII